MEVAQLADGAVGVRDSKNSTGPALLFTPEEWDSFLAGARDGTLTAGQPVSEVFGLLAGE